MNYPEAEKDRIRTKRGRKDGSGSSLATKRETSKNAVPVKKTARNGRKFEIR